VCIPYASKDEIAYAVNRCVQEMRAKEARRRANGNGHLQNGIICESDLEEDAISIPDIDSKMMLSHSPPLDILVRTSGVCRLSDFMLWQVGTLLSRGRQPGLLG
jgi:ditrans,polycis-polyprenyl diphosphate synthase